MSIPVFNPDQTARLKHLMKEGSETLTRVETLNEGLNDTIKAIAKELDIKPAVLKKAVKMAHKEDFQKASDDHELLETILETTGTIS